MKRLINGLLCSVLVLGLASNSGVSSSHAEENVVTSDPSNLSESLESDNQSEQSSEPSGSTENEENIVSDEKSSEMIDQISDQNNENNDISGKKSSASTEQPSVSSKKRASKAVLVTTKNQATTEDGQVFDLQDVEFTLNGNSITLTGYKGTKEDLVIPSKIIYGGHKLQVNVKINQGTDGSAKRLFPNTVKSISFVSVDSTKVGLESDTGYSLDYLFSIEGNRYDSLTSIDFSGLDMDKVTSMYATFYGKFVPNLKTINFGDNTLPHVTNMQNTFNQLSNLESIQQNWTFGSLKNMNQMFGMNTEKTKLTTIGDTSRWNTSTVTNMRQVFLNCSKLQSLDLSNWDVSHVTDMSEMFMQCQALTTIGNTGNWNVSNVTNFSNMFYNCISLNTIRMDNWKLKSNAEIGYGTDNYMFTLWDSNQPFPALIVASDKELLDFPYNLAGYKPSCEIRINANTGQVAKNEYQDFNGDDTGLSYYFDKVVIPTQQYEELSTLSGEQLQNKVREWLESNVPTKTGYALTGWAPTDQDFEKTIQSINSFDDFINSKAEFKAEWVSDKFDTSPDNTKLNPTGNLGLAYYPTAFTINSADLQSSGEQKIPIFKQESLNLGVKDRTRTTDKWHVTARLTWIGNQLPNAYIQATNSNGTVMQNISTGSGNYDPITDLQSLQGSGITGMANYKITTMPNTIMKSSGSTVNNGVYDYDLGDLKLVIPDVSQVRAGTYSGQVEWNLINGPA
ncbi:BspA family leucine-rich repeat surface protein [Enterococcus hirae]